MNKINQRVFFVVVNDVTYVVKYGKIDEFICLFLTGNNAVVINGMSSTHVDWEHEYQWYKRIG